MHISHAEVRRHPLWQNELAATRRSPAVGRSVGMGIFLALLGALALSGALYVLAKQ